MTERLTKSDWIKHGLSTLAREGAGRLKAGPLAEGLKVSRGSFYWHFADLADFRAHLLAAWSERTTTRVIDEIVDVPGPERLKYLLRRAFGAPNAIDRAMRAWATEDAQVAAAVAAVDDLRVEYIARYLTDAGVDPARTAARAAFLYWAYLGQAVVMDPRHATLSPDALDEIGELFER